MVKLDKNAKHRRETFGRYGLAMYHAQCVEKSLAILASVVFNKEFLPNDFNQREEILDEIFTKTIGSLLTRLKKNVAIPKNLGHTLENARKKRNWLAHEYFWSRAGEVMTTRGRSKMIEELDDISEFFLELDNHLISIYESWCIKYGISDKIIDKKLKELITAHE